MKTSNEKTSSAKLSDARRSQNTVEIDLVATKKPPERSKSRVSVYAIHMDPTPIPGQARTLDVPIQVVTFKSDLGLQDLEENDAFRVSGKLQCWHASNGRNFYSIHALEFELLPGKPAERINRVEMGLTVLTPAKVQQLTGGGERLNCFAQYRPLRARPMEMQVYASDMELGLQDLVKGTEFLAKGKLTYYKADRRRTATGQLSDKIDEGRKFYGIYTEQMEVLP